MAKHNRRTGTEEAEAKAAEAGADERHPESGDSTRPTEGESKAERREERRERREKDRDILAKEQPIVLESSASDPVFPAMQEYEVDEGGPKGSTRKHPGLIWAVIAVIAVAVLVCVFIFAGDWMTPDQAEQNAQTQFEEETVPEDLGAE